MKLPVDVNTDRIAFGLVLVASMVNVPGRARFHCAFLIATRSAAGGAPGDNRYRGGRRPPDPGRSQANGGSLGAPSSVFTWNVPLAVP